MYTVIGVILFSIVAAVGVFRRSSWAVLRQLWLEMGLLLLAMVAMTASMFVPPASGAEKSLVYLSFYSGTLLCAAGTLRMAINVVRTSRATKHTSGRH